MRVYIFLALYMSYIHTKCGGTMTVIWSCRWIQISPWKTSFWVMIWSPHWYKSLWACAVQTPWSIHHILKVNMQISLHHTHGYPISFIFMQIKCKLYHDHIKFDDDMLSSYSIAYSIITISFMWNIMLKLSFVLPHLHGS